MNQDQLYKQFNDALVELINNSNLCASAVLLILKQVQRAVQQQREKQLQNT